MLRLNRKAMHVGCRRLVWIVELHARQIAGTVERLRGLGLRCALLFGHKR